MDGVNTNSGRRCCCRVHRRWEHFSCDWSHWTELTVSHRYQFSTKSRSHLSSAPSLPPIQQELDISMTRRLWLGWLVLEKNYCRRTWDGIGIPDECRLRRSTESDRKLSYCWWHISQQFGILPREWRWTADNCEYLPAPGICFYRCSPHTCW